MFSKDKIKMEKMLRIQCCCLLCRLPTFGLGGPVTQRDEVVMYKVVTLLAKEETGRRLIEQTPVKSSGIYWVLTKETRFPLWGKMESKISRLLTSNNLLVCFLLWWSSRGCLFCHICHRPALLNTQYILLNTNYRYSCWEQRKCAERVRMCSSDEL